MKKLINMNLLYDHYSHSYSEGSFIFSLFRFFFLSFELTGFLLASSSGSESGDDDETEEKPKEQYKPKFQGTNKPSHPPNPPFSCASS